MSNTKFVSVDLEMANNNLESVCQLGVVVFDNFEVVHQWESLVNPQEPFGYYQTQVHGLKAEDVANAPTMEELKTTLIDLLEGNVVCSYGWNDYHALRGNFKLPSCTWIDVSRVVRTVLLGNKKGVKSNLRDVCANHNIAFPNHHNALADAMAAGNVLNHMMKSRASDLNDMLKFSKKMVGEEHIQDALF